MAAASRFTGTPQSSRPLPVVGARGLHFPTEEASATAADELAAKDWRVGLGRRDAEWLAQPERDMVVNETTLPAMNAELNAVATAGGGYYDGWEAAPTP